MNTPDVVHAPSDLRDRFLNAIDAGDRALCEELALDLRECVNPLPGMTREQLRLPVGSTYGSAARHFLESSRDPAASQGAS
jgi:hypothetical protein